MDMFTMYFFLVEKMFLLFLLSPTPPGNVHFLECLYYTGMVQVHQRIHLCERVYNFV